LISDEPRTNRIADRRLVAAIRARARDDPEYWAFATVERARGARELYQYPAMMVSPMQGELLELIVRYRGGLPRVTDGFVGSGTALAESMRLGLDFTGVDINPMAILICQVKARGAAGLEIAGAIERVAATRRRRPCGLLQDEWIGRWYRRDVAYELSLLRQAISEEPDLDVRRFLWVSLAEVARTTGNMRLSTPKLQRREALSLRRPIDVRGSFRAVAARNRDELERHTEDVGLRGHLTRSGRYRGRVKLIRGDVRDVQPARLAADVVLSSPPYGDNGTTMPYGQQSFLPLKWVEVDDVDPSFDVALRESARRLDGRSLGGSLRVNPAAVGLAVERSPALGRVLRRLRHERIPRLRIGSFFADLDGALDRVVTGAADDAHLVLTLGDRTVAGCRVANTTILCELLESRGCALLTTLQRPVKRNKRMAVRNGYSQTIRSETVLIMRRQTRR
jgi:hypothetical protein